MDKYAVCTSRRRVPTSGGGGSHIVAGLWLTMCVCWCAKRTVLVARNRRHRQKTARWLTRRLVAIRNYTGREMRKKLPSAEDLPGFSADPLVILADVPPPSQW